MPKPKFKIPIELIDTIRKNECILFVASGMSTKVIRSNDKALPNWKDFLSELLVWGKTRRLPFNSKPEEIEEIIEKGNYLMAAQELQEIMPINDFSDFLNNVFRDSKVKPTKSHEYLTKIPFRAILTTNYDTLIVGAYTMSSGGQIPKKYTQLDLLNTMSPLRKRDFFVFKMHGDIDRIDTIVMGSRSYHNLIYKSPEYLSFLETLFTTHTVLFLGFGATDPDFDYVIDRLSTIFSRTLDKHFILLPAGKYNYTERRRLLIDKRLEIIEYNPQNNHIEVDHFIEQLHQAINDITFDSKVKEEKKSLILLSTPEDEHKYADRFKKYFTTLSGYKFSSWINLSFYFSESEHGLREMVVSDFKKHHKLILIITEHSNKSTKFENEIEDALLKELEDKVTVIPIIIGDVEVPYTLRNRVYLRLSTDFKVDELKKLNELM